jgi:hypothetical protein
MATGRVPTTANSPLTAKGDLFTYSTAPARLAVGSNGDTIVADSSTATGLKWAKSPNFVGCFVYGGDTQSIPHATNTALTYSTEIYDTDGFHSTVSNTSRITIPTGLGGKYLVTVNTLWAPNATGMNQIKVFKNTSTQEFVSADAVNNGSYYLGRSISFILNLVAGDYFEIFAYQNSGVSVDIYKRYQEYPLQVQYLGA